MRAAAGQAHHAAELGGPVHQRRGGEARRSDAHLAHPLGEGADFRRRRRLLAERLKQLMEQEPIYVLKAGDQLCPVFESPLGLFDAVRMGAQLEERYKIPVRVLPSVASPWAAKRPASASASVPGHKSCKELALPSLGVARLCCPEFLA